MLSFKIFILIGITLQCTFETTSYIVGETLLSLREGINVYPPRTNRPPVTVVQELPTNSCPYSPEDAKQLLNSIDRIVNSFYLNNYQKIYMLHDAGIGLGVLKGQLNYLLGRREDKLSNNLKYFLGRLHETAGIIALSILDQFIEENTDTEMKLGAQVIRNHSHILKARFRDWIDFNRIKKYFPLFENIGDEKDQVFNNTLNFDCIVSLVKNCSIPPHCKEMYLARIYSQNVLIRQILYQQFAERRSCITIHKDAFGNAQEFRDRLCAKAYLEAEFLEKHDFPTRYIDLFAQQVGFCGLLGYPNFMKSDWLREIMSWQAPSKSGCITNLYGDWRTDDDAVVLADVGATSGKSDEPCLIHLTSSVLSALSVNLRYMADNCSPNIFDVQFVK